MCRTCMYAVRMEQHMIQIRNVPENLHRTLKAQAAMSGMSLSDYLLAEIRRLAERPTMSQLRERMQNRSKIRPAVAPADAIRQERDAR